MSRADWIKFLRFTAVWALIGASFSLLFYIFLWNFSKPSSHQIVGYITYTALTLNAPSLVFMKAFDDLPSAIFAYVILPLGNAVFYGAIGAVVWLIRHMLRSRK
jgi:type III secretory pathway component EscU